MSIIDRICTIIAETERNLENDSNPRETQLRELVNSISIALEGYDDFTDEQIVTIKNEIQEPTAYQLLGYAIEQANIQLAVANQRDFEKGFYALDLASSKLDRRDILRVLSLYYDLSVRQELSLVHLKRLDLSIAKILNEFIGRRTEDKAIEAMGYQLVSYNNRLRYESIDTITTSST